ncbi:unnamed protein product [Rotaria sordida]|uniref:RING-type domain-containing protein n=2 Tax=Rotaria sordida TaxID=392033 RepID=A0A819JQG4_9BILA|nr:unnamed protein product [Rotaria sordida]
MTSMIQKGICSDRVRGPSSVNVDLLECPICHDLLWIPVACQTCETSFCSTCIDRWLADNPEKCPNRCKTYIKRKCPSFIVKLLAQLQLTCYYQSQGCEQIRSLFTIDNTLTMFYVQHFCKLLCNRLPNLKQLSFSITNLDDNSI